MINLITMLDEPTRRTLNYVPYTPSPDEIINAFITSPGWPYKTRDEDQLNWYRVRDNSLIALVYLGALRISEALRISTDQFIDRGEYWQIQSVELSKSVVEGKPRNDIYREVRLPKTGERSTLTDMLLKHVNSLDYGEQLYKFTRQRAWQIITAIMPEHTCHWFRAYGEDYLYSMWNNDILAVADYVKVDARTLQQYIRGRWKNKPVA